MYAIAKTATKICNPTLDILEFALVQKSKQKSKVQIVSLQQECSMNSEEKNLTTSSLQIMRVDSEARITP